MEDHMNDTYQYMTPEPYGGGTEMPDDDLMRMPARLPELAGSAALHYPELYYKLQPHILAVCDQMDYYGLAMTEDILDDTGGKLREDVLQMHPEMTALDNGSPMLPEARQTVTYSISPGSGTGLTAGPRRRGLLRDLIDILLLAEYYRRRRYPYP
jgi:hypothetical protein